MRASLIPLGDGPLIEIVKDVTVIGRKEFCDVRLDDPSVSKVHLIIARTDGVLLFRDMASTNGTKVNGQRVIRGTLLPNDTLSIAALKYQVQLLPDEPSTEREPTNVATPKVDPSEEPRIFRAADLARAAKEAARPGEAEQWKTDRETRTPNDPNGETPFQPIRDDMAPPDELRPQDV